MYVKKMIKLPLHVHVTLPLSFSCEYDVVQIYVLDFCDCH